MLSRLTIDKLDEHMMKVGDEAKIISDMVSLLNIMYESRIEKIDDILCFSHVIICRRMKGWDNLFHKNMGSFRNMDNLLKEDLETAILFIHLKLEFELSEMCLEISHR